MTRASWPAQDVRKEVAALLPIWRGAAAIMVVAASVQAWASWVYIPAVVVLGQTAMVMAFGVACVALGVMSFGQEYGYATLSMLLTQPVSRRRIGAIKAAVLGAMLGSLGLLAWLLDRVQPETLGLTPVPAVGILLPILAGFFLAPAFTLLCRDELKGAVLTVLAPVGIWLLARTIGGAAGLHVLRPASDMWFLWAPTIAICAIVAAFGWRAFLELEVAGTNADMTSASPDAIGAAPAVSFDGPPPLSRLVRSHPVWLLLTKELRLQRVTFAITAVYVLCRLMVPWIREAFPGSLPSSVGGLTLAHAMVVAMTAGAFASAEERRLGTLPAQLLLPVAASLQWILKVVVVFAITAVLAIGVPLLFEALLPSVDDIRGSLWSLLSYALIPLMAAIGGLYASSLSDGGVRALFTSVIVLFSAWLLGGILIAGLGDLLSRVAAGMLDPLLPAFSVGWASIVSGGLDAIYTLLGVGAALIVLWYAFENHRRTDRSPARVSRQVARMAGTLLIGVLLASSVDAYYRAGTSTFANLAIRRANQPVTGRGGIPPGAFGRLPPSSNTNVRFPSCLILDFDGGGASLSSVADGVLFDMNADGTKERVGWIARGSSNGFLAMDANGNGAIDDATELVGNLFRNIWIARPASGISALLNMQGGRWENGRMVPPASGSLRLDADDDVFQKLRVWRDANHDGVTNSGELRTLEDSGIVSFSVGADILRLTQQGNQLRFQGSFDIARAGVVSPRPLYEVVLGSDRLR